MASGMTNQYFIIYLPFGINGAPAQNDYGEVVHRLPKPPPMD